MHSSGGHLQEKHTFWTYIRKSRQTTERPVPVAAPRGAPVVLGRAALPARGERRSGAFQQRRRMPRLAARPAGGAIAPPPPAALPPALGRGGCGAGWHSAPCSALWDCSKLKRFVQTCQVWTSFPLTKRNESRAPAWKPVLWCDSAEWIVLLSRCL